MTGLNIEAGASLKHLNSFGFEVTAETLITLTERSQLPLLMAHLAQSGDELLLLGGGSNLVLAPFVPGTVCHMAITGWNLIEQDESCLLQVGAGENWHDTVARTLDEGWYGLENLALIPGTVGAAPVQNIGAYGVELKDRVNRVEVYDREMHRLYWRSADECEFAYRDSIFKSGAPGRFIITAVEFRLSRKARVAIDYAPLQAELSGIADPSPQQVFEAVCRVRRSKLPSPKQLGNAGSFFKNPIVTAEQCAQLRARESELVYFAEPSGRCKLAAGWLIDRCGLKGVRQGAVGTYPKQALVLVNWGGGDREAVELLAERIQQQVQERFGVMLEPEPRFYP
ncbi:UDP-N-acetylmuramate dehydrogenase [Marinobacterium weihaiense]|uniref:UDP-N-acetylenolpyruvoylglucosamine reductase n=1 Tax=Marinobacterium weihaiense TaxID=2851016 RepID=A0ABS6M776_9GAMM|nr:UDP-N-acetylmuramate dehydrogenase [Marinobacterium weihaiense]MBV0932143.1 UDP-N-acetylmuramate dehydrogenase [Marinobacterium weihaiense]